MSRKTGLRGFNLVEILIAVALAALVLGVLLRTVGLQMVAVSRATDRYRSLLYASHVLERKLSEGFSGDSVTDEAGLDGYMYTLDVQVVTADPRVEQVKVVVSSPRGSNASLSAYRLRIRREQAPEAQP